jgi:hypothetical protein
VIQVGRSSGRVRLRPNRGFPRGLTRQCNPSQILARLRCCASRSVAHFPSYEVNCRAHRDRVKTVERLIFGGDVAARNNPGKNKSRYPNPRTVTGTIRGIGTEAASLSGEGRNPGSESGSRTKEKRKSMKIARFDGHIARPNTPSTRGLRSESKRRKVVYSLHTPTGEELRSR